ncbi:hypothetical protein GCM10010172_35430 [Paractinoplanes ferrugineus]|uniref:Putative exodeoxyribonuclease 8 PDDEXK-like domain-containing protein n=1 Tax=Paractinoplanes ferrugineus TaxID=113564 RepID=A0A919MLJ2_9ACTN|nr:PD-(D/E)XK nuclease-like domain-containing protein [Actinoplanes ferrugineus]GIE16875.1 hypothetical protein Afe05nite_87150 [Actinoplanes ferrugineus]
MTEFEGIVDMPEDEYHAHPALSFSGAKKLLHPSCPAIFRHEQDNPQPHKREFDLGHAAHKVVLGEGSELFVIGAENYKTKKAQQDRDDAYDRGEIPVLSHEFDQVQAMAAQVRAHPIAGPLFSEGLAEQSLFWTDPETGVPCRARLDWLSWRIGDYKTSTSAEPGHISKKVDDFGYYMQADHYLSGAVHLDLIAPDAPFHFVFQDKNPPYLVTVVELDDVALKIGHDRNVQAREIYRACMESGVWPAYSNRIERISLPAYSQRRYTEGIY